MMDGLQASAGMGYNFGKRKKKRLPRLFVRRVLRLGVPMQNSWLRVVVVVGVVVQCLVRKFVDVVAMGGVWCVV